MKSPESSTSRKKFIGWGAALLATLAGFSFLKTKIKKTAAPAKFLTQDGKLVEVDQNMLASSGKKISSKELQHWIKK